ncbi:recA-like protein [Erythrobacter sp. T5W1-R]|uniref:recA-like protein n=1 Tax=Erythrobacter sp. T5W1-R TaxID=3101752 RepID=UPI002AFE1F99|nr:recA-like protein [Erythrobacter sp. T5W1-R]MEA1619719.1 recA-like protein [Erythrobacter sp. T5W1-R]
MSRFSPSLPVPSVASSYPGGARRAAARWRPGLASQPLHSEIFAPGHQACGVGLALALARDALKAAADSADAARRHVLWVQDRAAIRLGGRPYLHGLPADLRYRVIHVAATSPEDALFAMEEGLKCRDLACVIGEVAGNPRTLDFTASRRLSLAAERAGIALWLVRLDAAPDLSSARMRWRAAAAPSLPPRWNPTAPGAGRWHAELFRARAHLPGEWMLSDDAGALRAERVSPLAASPPDHGDLADGSGARSLAAG